MSIRESIRVKKSLNDLISCFRDTEVYRDIVDPVTRFVNRAYGAFPTARAVRPTSGHSNGGTPKAKLHILLGKIQR